jgi:glycerol-3-phosphate cytidylyltransferase
LLKKKRKRILVDMSGTLIHHGHIRLLKKAYKLGDVFVALTSDKQIKKYKGYQPELNFSQRKEIFTSIKYVKKVIKSNWVIDESFLKKNNISLLIHGNDNSNKIKKTKLKIFKRTKGISSNLIRRKACKILKKNI